LEISQFLNFQVGSQLPSWIFKFLVANAVKRSQCTSPYKILAKLSDHYENVAFNSFQNDGHLPSWMGHILRQPTGLKSTLLLLWLLAFINMDYCPICDLCF